MSDMFETVTLRNVQVQANGIIRNEKGRLIARLVDDCPYDSDPVKGLATTHPHTTEQVKADFEAKLKQIGWTIKGNYPNSFVYDHNGKRTAWRVMGDRLELTGAPEHTATCFYFKASEAELLDGGDAVSLGTPECFTLFMNHNIERATPPTKTDKPTP